VFKNKEQNHNILESITKFNRLRM